MLAWIFAFACGVLVFALFCRALGWALGIGLGVILAPFAFLGGIIKGILGMKREAAGHLGAAEAVARKATAEGASWEEVKRRVAQLR